MARGCRQLLTGGPAHAAAARPGRGSRSSSTYDVVCAPQADESDGRCAPEGSVFVRSAGTDRLRGAFARARARGAALRAGSASVHRRRRLRLLRPDRSRRRRAGDRAGRSGRGSAACLVTRGLDDGRPRGAPVRRDRPAVVDPRRVLVGPGPAHARARQRSRAIADRPVGLRHRSRWLGRRARSGEPQAVGRPDECGSARAADRVRRRGRGSRSRRRRDDLRPRGWWRRNSACRSLVRTFGRSDRGNTCGGAGRRHGSR